MRIALIDPSLFTLPYDVALSGGLQAEGHEVTLFARRPGAEDDSVEGTPLAESFYRCAGSPLVLSMPKEVRLAVKGIDHLFSIAALGRRLSRSHPEVLHFQWLPLPLIDRWFLPGLRRVAPLVLTVHDSKAFNGDPAAGLQQYGAAATFDHFERLIVHTEQGRERLVRQGVAVERIALLPHGLLGRTWRQNDDSKEMLGRLTFLLFGQLKPYKGIDLLIEAFARLPDDLRSRACLRVVGKPFMAIEPLRVLARQLGVEPYVTIEPRFVPEDEVAGLFASGTVATFPYREIEASGVLALAIRHGRPILASRLGGFLETVTDERHGILVPPGDASALAGAMSRFLLDRSFAASCARNVRVLADTIPDWRDIARRTCAVYSAATDTPARAAAFSGRWFTQRGAALPE